MKPDFTSAPYLPEEAHRLEYWIRLALKACDASVRCDPREKGVVVIVESLEDAHSGEEMALRGLSSLVALGLDLRRVPG